MIGGDVCALFEGESVNAVRGIEHTVDQYAVHIEVRFHLIVRDIQHGLLHFCRIVETVVGLQLEVLTFCLLGKCLNGLCLSVGLGRILLDEVLQEGIDVVGRLGHRFLQRVGCIVGIPHDGSLLGTQLGNLAYDGESVVFGVRTISTMDRGFIYLLTQFTVVETCQWCLLGGIHDDDGIRSLTPTALGILGALGDVGLTESCQIFLLVHPYHSVIGGIRQQVSPLLLQLRDAQVDLLHTCHFVVRQQGTSAHEVLIGLLQQLLILPRQ